MTKNSYSERLAYIWLRKYRKERVDWDDVPTEYQAFIETLLRTKNKQQAKRDALAVFAVRRAHKTGR